VPAPEPARGALFISLFFKYLRISRLTAMQMIIANTLADGFVVFLTEENGWSNDIADGALAASDAEADDLLARAKQAEQDNVVIDPYLIPVEVAGGERRPTEYREYIRATGPTVPIPS